MASGDVTTPLLNPAEAPPVVVANAAPESSAQHLLGEAREFAGEVKGKAVTWFQYVREETRKLKHECVVLFYALQDPRTSKWSKLMPILVLSYVLSPIDLIPDCIPVIGVLDDLLIAPALIWLAVRLIPKEVLADARHRADNEPILLGSNWVFATLIFIVWLLALELAAYFLLKNFLWGYSVVRHWFGTFLALLFVGLVAYFVYFVIVRIKYEKQLKAAFQRGVEEAREAIAARSAAPPV